jgi:hypothetical protein
MTRKPGTYKHSKETKKKIGKKSRGRRHTEATKKRLSELHSGEVNPMYGKPAANRGKPMSKRQRNLLSNIHKERFTNGAKVWHEGTKGIMNGTWTGKRFTRTHRRHISEAKKKWWKERKQQEEN